MIIDKKSKVSSIPEKTQTVSQNISEETPSDNGLIEAYKAVKKILKSIKRNPDDPESEPFFRTIKMDNGQLSRIKNDKINREYGVAFPAIFIHFIDVRYNIGMSRVSEGKGIMRLHYILNRLNNSDEDFELEGLKIYQRIVEAIETQKNNFPALVSRFQLQYWDQPLSFDDGLQPYWIDYEIWFQDTSTVIDKNYVDAYVVCPPFTHHSDQNETANPEGLPDDIEPKFEDVAGFTTNKGSDI